MAYGTVNADVISTSVANTSLGAGNATRFKNRIINGDMRIDQRNAGASLTTAAASPIYSLDRWLSSYSQTSKFTLQQNAGSVTPPAGFINYLGVTSSSAYSVVAGDYFLQRQPIEGLNVADLGWGTANAKTVTLSFWVRSSLTGTFGGSVTNSNGTRSYPYTYTISAANTWEQKSVTIAGDTSGTWLTTNGIGINIDFSLGTGSTYSGTSGVWSSSLYLSATGATSVVGTSGATFYITGVQLEVGSSATGFEYVDYATQLAMCQRYYQKYPSMILGSWGNNNYIYQSFIYAVQMRTAPTWNYTNVGYAAASSIGTNTATNAQVRINIVITAGGGYGYSTFDMDTSGAEL